MKTIIYGDYISPCDILITISLIRNQENGNLCGQIGELGLFMIHKATGRETVAAFVGYYNSANKT